MSKNDRKTIELQRNEILRMKPIEEELENTKVSNEMVQFINNLTKLLSRFAQNVIPCVININKFLLFSSVAFFI